MARVRKAQPYYKSLQGRAIRNLRWAKEDSCFHIGKALNVVDDRKIFTYMVILRLSTGYLFLKMLCSNAFLTLDILRLPENR